MNSRYGWNLNDANDLYKSAREEFSSLADQFCTKLSVNLCLSTDMNPLKSPTPCCSQTLLKPNDINRSRGSEAQLTLLGNRFISSNISIFSREYELKGSTFVLDMALLRVYPQKGVGVYRTS